uniref:Transmembrane 7 superfamily member 3 n=1 Tax=Jaculus jaculus TaxID=51337 RepID=A0A8C5KJE8_JACJA
LLEFSMGKFTYLELSRPFLEEAILRHISGNVTFLIFQIHSQYQNTTVSFSRIPLLNTSGTGSDRGLAFLLRPQQTVCTWFLKTEDAKPVQNVAVPLSYSEKDPIPGGCNLEFDLDIDPNIYLDYDFYETTIRFAPANLGYAVVTLTANDKTSVSFSSLPGQGVIYNVVVRDPLLNTSAAYVPAHTYACSFEATEGNCTSLELFFIGFIILGFFFWILITRLTSVKYDGRLILTAAAGSTGGFLLVAAWWRFGVLMPCMLCVGLVLGFLIAAATLFTPLGNLKVFHDDGVYWVTFSCIALFIPVVFMGCLRILSILTGGIVGSYSVVLAIDSYVNTSLSYITLNVLRRALNTDFRRTFENMPFQTDDFIVLAVWGMVAVSGITLQIRRERGQPPFPPHPYRLWKQERERRVTNILDPSYHVPPLRERLYGQFAQIKELFQKEQPTGERTPLLL